MKLSVNRPPFPALYILPETPGAYAALIHSPATSSTNVKSRDCSPSPKIVGEVRASRCFMNKLSTPEYALDGSCRGPYTLKNRSATVSIPKHESNTDA